MCIRDSLRDIDRSVDIMCLWFFRERTDRDAGNDIKLAGKIINYHANKILITPSKEIKTSKGGVNRRTDDIIGPPTPTIPVDTWIDRFGRYAEEYVSKEQIDSFEENSVL